MGIEFIGMIAARKTSEIHAPADPIINREYIKLLALAHEQAGFDRVLVASHCTDVDAFGVIYYAAGVTRWIKFMLTHRPGFVAPTLAARKLATLDQFSGGRLGVHIISGGEDEELQRDGDFLTDDQRHGRTDEYLDVVRRIWTADQPIDHEGTYYRVKGGFSDVRSVQKPHIPIYLGGASDAAVAVAGRHADIYALSGDTPAQAREQIGRVQAEVAKHGRQVRFSVSFRPILGDTEAEAWARAERILAETRRLRAARGVATPDPGQSMGARRLRAAAQGERLDRRLWTAIAKETGARSNATALVGTAEQVANALLDYYDLGVSTFFIRGFDPLEDAIEYGLELIPLTRALVAERALQRKAG